MFRVFSAEEAGFQGIRSIWRVKQWMVKRISHDPLYIYRLGIEIVRNCQLLL